jgi:DNA-binding beta-propeller fold protein YncE
VKPVPTPSPTRAVAAPAASAATTALYAFDADWGSTGAALNQLQVPEGVDVSEDGEVYIADSGNNRILVWDADGKPLRSIGSFGPSAVWRNPPQFNHPVGVRVLPLKKLYVADGLNHRIVVLDSRGLVAGQWGERGQGEGQFDRPRDLDVDRYGNVWVLDSGNNRMQIFSGMGAFKSQWGSFGKEEGQLKFPLGFALNIIEQTVVADTENYRYQVFNDKGAPVTQFGWYGDGPGQFKEPGGVAIAPSGVIAITDGENSRVVFLNARFEPAGEWRADRPLPGARYLPRFRGIASDRLGRLYVTDIRNDMLVRLKPLGKRNVVIEGFPTATPEDSGLYGGPGYPVR